MFFLRRNCVKCISRQSGNRFGSFQTNLVECEPRNDNKDGKIVETSIRTRNEPENNFNENKSEIKVGIIGGGMAPIYASLLLKQSRLIKRINIADPTDKLAGAVHDLNHIDTSTKIKYYGKGSMNEALADVDIVALMDENDFDMGADGPMSQFVATSSYVRKMSDRMVLSCPSALVAVFARPVTASLPMISEIYKRSQWWDPNRILGSTAIDAMRVESMTASLFDLNPSYLSVPIVGGADPCTVVPLLTRAKPVNQFRPEHEAMLVRQLRSADKELVDSVIRYKGPSLSSGAAAAKFIKSLASALSGIPNITCSAYVRSDVLPICRYFSNELLFGRQGVEKNYGLPKVSPLAVDLIEQSIPHINELSEMAMNIVRNTTSCK